MNPFAGQWTTSGGGASVFGALPFASPPSGPHLVPFNFRFKTSVLNSEVVGPNDRLYFRVQTDERQNMYTGISSQQQVNAGHIEWRPTTLIEFSSVIQRQRANDWVQLDSRTGARQTTIAGRHFTWAADNQHVYLQSTGSHPEVMARITRQSRSVSLEIVAQALSVPGILESCVMATILFLSGRELQ
ncbi:hypothetical protein DL96DRAFT_506566 [Flagelloscypha sp. PMI_526]|nr:hypothetical protein DL96DRAFT_506566 [Flagelloscypha sp. PMI_526]